MKLIPMTDFILELKKSFNYKVDCPRIFNYADFLKQNLELGMFITCDEEGTVLKKPYLYDTWEAGSSIKPRLDDGNKQAFEQYQRAKERCLFKGVEVFTKDHDQFVAMSKEEISNYVFMRFGIDTRGEWYKRSPSDTVERLLNYNIQLELTPTAIKQIGLWE